MPQLENLPEVNAASDPRTMRTFVFGELIPFFLGLISAILVGVFFQGEQKLLYCVLSVLGGVVLWGMLLLYRFINYLVYFFWYVHETTTPLMDTLVSSFGGPSKVSKS